MQVVKQFSSFCSNLSLKLRGLWIPLGWRNPTTALDQFGQVDLRDDAGVGRDGTRIIACGMYIQEKNFISIVLSLRDGMSIESSRCKFLSSNWCPGYTESAFCGFASTWGYDAISTHWSSSFTMASGGQVTTTTSTNQQPANRTEILYGGGSWRSLITAPSSTFTVIFIVFVLCRCVQWGAAATIDATEG